MVTGITTEAVTLGELLTMTAKSNEVRYCRSHKDAEAFIADTKVTEARWGRMEPEFRISKIGRQVVVMVVRAH